jgi:hypothetical protein
MIAYLVSLLLIVLMWIQVLQNLAELRQLNEVPLQELQQRRHAIRRAI